MGLTDYQSTKAIIGKALVIAVATLAPPWLLVRSAQDAVVTHSVAQRLEESRKKPTLETGDIVWVSGAVRSTPLDVTPHFSDFRDELRLVERIQEHRRGYKSSHWTTVRETEWVTAEAIIGEWRLAPDIIRKGGFGSRDLSPCTDYRPASNGWTVECPGADYAYAIGNHKRRMSYQLTPAPRGRVSLIAAVAGDRLDLIAAKDTWHAPFAILALGERDPHAMLAHRLRGDWAWMAFWWAITAAVAGLWMRASLRSARPLDRGELFVGCTWRAICATAPLLALYAVFPTAYFMPAALGAAGAATFIGFCLWFLAGDEPSDLGMRGPRGRRSP